MENTSLAKKILEKNIMNEETIGRWFNSKTDADRQLNHVINTNKFQPCVPTHTSICKTLFQCENLFHNYNPPVEGYTIQYFAHISDKTFQCIISLLGYHPKFGIEVGSFIGSSAVLLGNFLKQNNGVLMCVDTFCGDINMWLMDGFHETMAKKDGNPKIYDHFMKKMISNELTETVVPLRVSSIVAARMLNVLKYEIDFVYLDSAHEAGETFIELMLYHDILKPGGVLFGDDYEGFPAVKYDVDLFCKCFNYTLTFTGDGDTWIIQKSV